MKVWIRWLKFNAVGTGGVVVQLLVLAVLHAALQLGYLPATAIAVEIAVVHNFFWHERFTWKEREARNRFARFLKFNLSNGAISIIGNLVLMKVLVEMGRINFLLANGLAIVACSAANFLISDRFVFEVTG